MFQGGAASLEDSSAASELIFFITLIIRVEAAFWLATAVGCFYAITLPFERRQSICLMLFVFGTLVLLIDGNHAGMIPFGGNKFVTENGKNAGFRLMATWAFILPLLLVGVLGQSAVDKTKKE